MLETEGSFSPEAFELQSYEEAIENILLDNDNDGITWNGLLASLYKQFWGPTGIDMKLIMTPERIQKIDSALRQVGALKYGTPTFGLPDLWFAKNTHGPSWFEKKVMGLDDRTAW